MIRRTFGRNADTDSSATVTAPAVSSASIGGGYVVLGFAVLCGIFTVVMLPRVM